ncbi:hypothetical protein PFISCL1PPCAC_2328, partial [Pristionchus fissidentatus]
KIGWTEMGINSTATPSYSTIDKVKKESPQFNDAADAEWKRAMFVYSFNRLWWIKKYFSFFPFLLFPLFAIPFYLNFYTGAVRREWINFWLSALPFFIALPFSFISFCDGLSSTKNAKQWFDYVNSCRPAFSISFLILTINIYSRLLDLTEISSTLIFSKDGISNNYTSECINIALHWFFSCLIDSILRESASKLEEFMKMVKIMSALKWDGHSSPRRFTSNAVINEETKSKLEKIRDEKWKEITKETFEVILCIISFFSFPAAFIAFKNVNNWMGLADFVFAFLLGLISYSCCGPKSIPRPRLFAFLMFFVVARVIYGYSTEMENAILSFRLVLYLESRTFLISSGSWSGRRQSNIDSCSSHSIDRCILHSPQSLYPHFHLLHQIRILLQARDQTRCDCCCSCVRRKLN